MSPTLGIVLLWLAFTATHLGLASTRVEPTLRRRLGDAGFLVLYSAVAFAVFVPLVWVYFSHRHAGSWLWVVSVGPVLRGFLYAGIVVGFILGVGALVQPSPSALVPGEARVAGVYRVTRHPLVLGFGIVWALHLIPNGSSADVAFFGGFLLFSLVAAWHQDRRKLASGGAEFRRFYDETSFLPFGRRGWLRGVREIPVWVVVGGLALAVGVRWLHGSIWPH